MDNVYFLRRLTHGEPDEGSERLVTFEANKVTMDTMLKIIRACRACRGRRGRWEGELTFYRLHAPELCFR